MTTNRAWAMACRDLYLGIGLGAVLFRAMLRVQRRRSLLGLFWLFAPSIVAAIGASYAQDRGLMTVRSVGMPYPAFVFSGAIVWQSFIEALNAPSRILSANRTVITRMRVAHEGYVIAGLCEVVAGALARWVILVGLCIVLAIPLTPLALVSPFALAGIACLGLGIGLLLAPLVLLYEDIARAMLLTSGALVVVAPVAFPVEQTGWQRFDPLIPLVDMPRALMMGGVPAAGFVPAVGIAVAVLLVAWPFYRTARPHVLARLG